MSQGVNALNARHKMFTDLLSQRRMPDEGWEDATIEYLLMQLSMMDSNNFASNVGVGEREARIFSALVSKRMYGLGHGIGRSGDVRCTAKSSRLILIVQLSSNDAKLVQNFWHFEHEKMRDSAVCNRHVFG